MGQRCSKSLPNRLGCCQRIESLLHQNKDLGSEVKQLDCSRTQDNFMRLLMIGFDQTIITEGASTPADTRERHIKYANALRQNYPAGNMIIILKVPPSWSSQPTIIGEGLTIIPVPSRRSTFMLRAILTLRQLLRGQSFDVVTTQTRSMMD